PQQEIRYAHLSACSNQEIGIGQSFCKQPPLYIVLGYGRRVPSGSRAFGSEVAARGKDLGPPTVIQSNRQDRPGVRCGLSTRVFDLAGNRRFERLLTANRLKPDVVVLEAANLLPKKLAKQAHQRFHFETRSLPVLGRECVES